MGIIKISTEIDVSVEKVFHLVKDEKRMLDLVPLPRGKIYVEKLTEGPLQVGTEFSVAYRVGFFTLKLWTSKVIELVENRLYHTRSSSGFNFKASIWTLESLPRGTRLTRYVKYELPGSVIGKVVDRLWVNRWLKKKTTLWIKDIKKYLEKEERLQSL